MPRDSNGIWSDIPNIVGVGGAIIESADWNNYRADLAQNEFNAARPITAGGTGANNAVDALNNLGGVGVANFLDAYAVGDFYETIRTLDSNWLRRNGQLYLSATYPELAALLPALPDGVQWSNVSVGQTGQVAIVSKPGGGFLIGREYSPTTTDIFSSTDGDIWNLVATIPNFVINDFTYGGGVYLATDANGKVFTSSDGVVWSATSSTIAGGTTPFCTSVAYGAGIFVATTGNSAGRYIHSSPDGITWTLRYTNTGTDTLRRVRYANSTFGAVGDNGTMATSTNGTAWTARTTGTTQTLRGFTYGGTVYVTVGGNGVILTSTNLASWTARTSSTTQALNDVIFSTAGFIAVGDAGTARISAAASGTTWASTATGTSVNLTDVAFDAVQQNKYVVVQAGSTSALKGVRTLPTQFQVPSDDPVYGWIRAVPQA